MNSISNDISILQPTDFDVGQVFSGKPSGTTVRGYAVPSAYTPAIDHGYIFHESSRDVVVWFLKPRGHIHPPECPRFFAPVQAVRGWRQSEAVTDAFSKSPRNITP